MVTEVSGDMPATDPQEWNHPAISCHAISALCPVYIHIKYIEVLKFRWDVYAGLLSQLSRVEPPSLRNLRWRRKCCANTARSLVNVETEQIQAVPLRATLRYVYVLHSVTRSTKINRWGSVFKFVTRRWETLGDKCPHIFRCMPCMPTLTLEICWVRQATIAYLFPGSRVRAKRSVTPSRPRKNGIRFDIFWGLWCF